MKNNSRTVLCEIKICEHKSLILETVPQNGVQQNAFTGARIW